MDNDKRNLWELLNATQTHDEAREGTELKNKLDKQARYGMQEISLECTPRGWVVKVFAVDGEPKDCITLIIPKSIVNPLLLTTSEEVVVKNNVTGHEVTISPPIKG